MPVIQFFINQRLFINLLTVMILILGWYSLDRINRERFPLIDFDYMIVTSILPGSSPADMEELVTNIIEDKLRGAEGVTEIESSSMESRSSVYISIDPDFDDKRYAKDNIRRLVDEITGFPPDMEPPLVTEASFRKRPIGSVIISQFKDDAAEKTPGAQKKAGTKLEQSGEKEEDFRALRDTALLLEDKLNELPFVAEVTRDGLLDREFRVEIKPDALKYYNVGIDQVLQSITARNTVLPGGKLLHQGKELALQVGAKVESVQQLGQTIIQANEDGQVVYLSQLADVKDTFEEQTTIVRVNPHAAKLDKAAPAITLTVLKKPNADTISAIEELQTTLNSFQQTLNPGKYSYNFEIIDDDSKRIRSRLDVLTSNSLMGIVLVLIALMIFLNFRMALVTAVGIPLAFGLCFVLMKAAGFTLNMATMIGLIIVVGMLVDDAIIVAENIFRHLENGAEPDSAALHGTVEVIRPVTATILTTMAAFSPMLLMSGFRGKMSLFIAVVVILALLGSWLECMFALPAHSADFLKPKNDKPNRLRAKLDGIFIAQREWYTRVLDRALSLRHVIVAGAFILLIVAGWYYGAHIKQVPWPKDIVDSFSITCKGPPGSSLDETKTRLRAVESRLLTFPVVKDHENPLPDEVLLSYRTTTGVWQSRPNSPWNVYGSNYGLLRADILPDTKRNITTNDFLEQVREKMTPLKEEMGFDCNVKESLWRSDQKGGVEVLVRGRDSDKLEKIKDRFYKYFDKSESGYRVSDEALGDREVLQLDLNYSELAILGLDQGTVGRSMRVAYEGTHAGTLRFQGEEVGMKVVFPKELRENLNSLNFVYLANRTGNLIALNQFTIPKIETAESVISHKDHKRTMTILLAPEEEADPGGIVEVVQKNLQPGIEADFPGYPMEFGGTYKEQQDAQSDIYSTFLVALLFIFLILVTTFQSIVQPVIVMTAIPLGFIGAVATLILHNDPSSFMAGIGFIGLVGVVVNDSLVMVDFINKQIKQGYDETNARLKEWYSLKPASWSEIWNNPFGKDWQDWLDQSRAQVVAGAKLRFRPVVLTTVTTFAGLLPTAYGIGGDDPYIRPLALVFAWGLAFATINTLIFIPALYLTYFNASMKQRQMIYLLNNKLRGWWQNKKS